MAETTRNDRAVEVAVQLSACQSGRLRRLKRCREARVEREEQEGLDGLGS